MPLRRSPLHPVSPVTPHSDDPPDAPHAGRARRSPALGVRLRRVSARRPWLQWVAIGALAVAVAASVHDEMSRLDAARDALGRTREVLVSTRAVHAGEPVPWRRVDVPLGLLPDAPYEGGDHQLARHDIGAGEILVTSDVMAIDGPLSLAPSGWLVVPVVESPPSGARPGDRVRAASEGVVLVAEAIVVGGVDDVTLLATPEADAPLLAFASDQGGLSLLLVP